MRTAFLESTFSSAHLYYQKDWSFDENKKIFGRCFTDHGHGHNYKLKLEIQIPDSISAKQMNSWLKEQKQILHEITKELDHEHLNFVIPRFKETVPTTENILIYLSEKVSASKMAKTAKSLQLFEMEDLWTKINLEK